MSVSQNGWSVITSAQDRNPFPGTTVVPLPGLRSGDVAYLLLYVGSQFHKRVEKLSNPGCWGWANKKVAGSTVYSNHASGTAIDLNAPKHPQFKKGTFAADHVKEIRKILAECSSAVAWGGNWELARVDEMHFEINGSAKTVAEAVKKLKGQDMSKDKLTRENVIDLHLAYTGSQPGNNYDWRHVGGPLDQCIQDFKKLPRPNGIDPIMLDKASRFDKIQSALKGNV